MKAECFAAALKDAEVATDDTLANFTKLMLAAQAVSIENALKFGEPQAVYADLAEAMMLQTKARHHLARAHAKALEIGERHSIVPTGWGDTVPTYEANRDDISTVRLRVAA